MDSNFLWLVAAGAAVWLGLAAYLVFMGCAQRRLDARLRQMEILHMALGMLMNAPRGDACIMMAPGDMLPDLISDTPRKDVQLFTITVRRPTATLIVDMTAYSASF